MAFNDEIDYTYEHDYHSTGNRVGLALIEATGMFSAISTMILLGYIVWHSLLNKHRELPMVQGIRSFTHSALGVFLINLLLSDLIQGAAFAINFKWAADGNMHPSVACTAQGSVSQVGDLGSAIWSLAIAYYTFRPGLFAFLWSSGFENGRLVWNWSSNGLSFGSFIKGTTSTSIPTRPSAVPRPAETAQATGIGKHLKTISKRLMLYPLVYSIVTIPVAVCRIGTLAGWKPPFGLYIFAGIAFSSSGIANVILFIATRHSLLRRSVSIQPRIRVTTHQVTVLEDARGVQAIHLNNLTIASPTEELASEKIMTEDRASVISTKYAPSSRSAEAPLVPCHRSRTA
ncbi:hypothetical protein RSOLAG22IIIB_11700 [Rhizoctonia solani]|uniref:G-protein coupled receptors family 1 profile domain-containing protein n=1 Tax=Rhizoctonia solani TaxID=456999 RepID=A0A0K6G9T3_9AGAM|nr:hypothetical protein RSOLAG22IIIB_11700 [Rhizoctonia solani]